MGHRSTTVLKRLYEGRLRDHFSRHPNGQRIVDAMLVDQLSDTEIADAFTEAAYYNREFLDKLGKAWEASRVDD